MRTSAIPLARRCRTFLQPSAATPMDEALQIESERSSSPSFLRQMARRPQAVVAERCELCNVGLDPMHPHLLRRTERQIVCSCDACAMLFDGRLDAALIRIPRRIRTLIGFQLGDLEWEALMLPINLAFFYQDTSAGKIVAMYPSAAGAVESQLTLEGWNEIAEEHPALASMEPDVETFLVNRIGSAREYYIVPIDECFRLIGIIRLHWRGLSGGVEVWKEVNGFFAHLRARGTEVYEPKGSEPAHA